MRFFFLFASITLSLCLHAQWFNNISTFTTENGLSNNTIACLQKDQDGFLWIGTHEGLNRYDGTEFINVLSNAKNNLPSNSIRRICFINKHLMAVGTDEGLSFLNTETLVGTNIQLPLNKKFPLLVADMLYKKQTHELWVGTWQGLFVVNDKGSIVKKMMCADEDMSKGFFARYLATDRQNNVYFFSQQKARFLYPDFEKNTLTEIEKKLPEFNLNDFIQKKFAIRSLLRFDHEITCVFSGPSQKNETTEYLAYYNIITGRYFINQVKINFRNEKHLFDAYPLNDSVFLINSYFGEPILYYANDDRTVPASNNPLWFTSWPDGFTATLFKDENYIWIGTSKGLLQSSLSTNFFKSNAVLIDYTKTNPALVYYNYGMFYRNKFWLTCLGTGLFSLDTSTNEVQSFFDNKTPAEFSKKVVSAQVVAAGNYAWLFSVYGPAQIDPSTKKIMHIGGANKDSVFDNYANYPLKDSKGNIWTTLPDGIAKYNIAANSFTNYKTKYKGGEFPLLRAGPKTEDAFGNIWMARNDTLVKFDAKSNTFSSYIVQKKDKHLSAITGMASDGNDVLYLSFADAFGMYHISTGALDIYTKQTGIISTAINDIVSDKQGNAWIATESGLVFYNKQMMQFSSFTKADGLPDDNVMAANFADDEKTILFLGFTRTYCLFKPQGFLQQKNLPANAIIGFTVNGESLDFEERQKFSYKQNNISFNYTGINYNQGQQNNYACILQGFDQDWKYPGTERKINYVNLPPGEYTFKVKSANHQGEWNEQAASFSFEILPPFWQQWWFIMLMICAAVAGSYYFIKRREALIKKQNSIKLQMSELRLQALRAQMNPHFIFNSLNSIQNYILTNNTIDAAAYLSKFAKLIRRILDQSKHNFLPLGEVMETLKMYVEIEAFRFSNEFSYTFNVEEDDDLLDARVPPMMLQPFVENAILHGLMPKQGEKKLIVNCTLINNAVEIIIDDNGIGRTEHKPKAGHTSQGEKLTAGMAESLQQMQNITVSIEIIDKKINNTPAGTTVKIILPLKEQS